MAHLSRAAALAALLFVGACSPTFNWREWPVEGTPLRATVPCKPDIANRSVPMLGSAVELHMISCETGGLRFALAWADVGRASQVPVALAAWRRASLQAIKAGDLSPGDPAQNWPVNVAGAPQAQGVQAQGTGPQGAAVQTRTVYFASGTQVFQAAIYGARLNSEVVDTFFSGLSLPPP